MSTDLKIGLLGKMRSGKDTVASYLIKEYGFKSFAFGDGIGDVIDAYFPQAWEDGKPRKHYQVIGQSFRQLNEDVWVEQLLNKVKDCKGNVVITDTRQSNEVMALKKEGYKIIKIISNDANRIDRIQAQGDTWDISTFTHETEIGVDKAPFDYLIINNGTLEDLHKEVKTIINKIRIEK